MDTSQALSQQINMYDYNDPNSNANYSKEITELFQKIYSDLQREDIHNTGKLTENQLLNHLRSRLTPGKEFKEQLFQTLFQDLERNNDSTIDISEFTRKYIQIHEQVRLTLENMKIELEKDKILKSELPSKILEAKSEVMTQNGISPKSALRIEIGQVELFNPNITDIFFKLLLDGQEKKTSRSSGTSMNFIERIQFPITTKNTTLTIGLFESENPNVLKGQVDIPLTTLPENEELNIDLQLTENFTNIAMIKPKLVLITSYYNFYQHQLDEVNQRLQDSQKLISNVSESLDGISDPYKDLFNEAISKGIIASNTGNKVIDYVEGNIKKIFKQRDVKWLLILKWLLYLCIAVLFITTLAKPEFIAILVFLCVVIMINTDKHYYLFENFYKVGAVLLSTVVYDVIDYMCLRKVTFDTMKTVNAWVKVFGMVGFIGKVLVLFFFWVAKVKYRKRGILG